MKKILVAAALLFIAPANAQVTISGLPSATTPLGGSEVAAIVQGGATKKAPASAFVNLPTVPFTGLSGTFASLTVGGITYPAGGTSGGIPYFSGASILSSGVLGTGLMVQGGGTGGAPNTFTLGGDCTFSTPNVTCTKTNGVSFSSLATTTPGTGVATALGVNVGTAGAFVVNGGALGTPSSGTATNLTGLPISGISGLGSGVGTALGNTAGGAGGFALVNSSVSSFSAGTTGLTPNSATTGAVTLAGTLVIANGGTNCAVASITCFNNITGFSAAGTTGTTSTNLVFSTNAVLVNPALGTPASGVATNLTGTASGLTAGNVTTNANLTGLVTSVGNTTALNLAQVTNSLSGDVALNNIANYFDGPSIAQGATGTWFASGSVTLLDTAGTAVFLCKLWDGTTVIDSRVTTAGAASQNVAMTLSGQLATPAGNLRISCRDQTSTSGAMKFNSSGNSKDSTITAFRIN